MSYKSKVIIYLSSLEKTKKMEKYVNFIEKYNKVMNLTSFSGDKLWKEGIYESLVSLDEIVKKGKLLDIGAGVGFPSLPLIIANPKIQLTIMDPKIKRIKFLQKVVKELELNVRFIIGRAEDSNIKEEFDFITGRAVAPLFKLIEISHQLGKIGSKFIWIKGSNVNAEIDDAQKIIKKLNLDIKNKKICKIKNKQIHLVIYDKDKSSPSNIPRNWSHIK